MKNKTFFYPFSNFFYPADLDIFLKIIFPFLYQFSSPTNRYNFFYFFLKNFSMTFNNLCNN
jgi:hypothetical protein